MNRGLEWVSDRDDSDRWGGYAHGQWIACYAIVRTGSGWQLEIVEPDDGDERFTMHPSFQEARAAADRHFTAPVTNGFWTKIRRFFGLK